GLALKPRLLDADAIVTQSKSRGVVSSRFVGSDGTSDARIVVLNRDTRARKYGAGFVVYCSGNCRGVDLRRDQSGAKEKDEQEQAETSGEHDPPPTQK